MTECEDCSDASEDPIAPGFCRVRAGHPGTVSLLPVERNAMGVFVTGRQAILVDRDVYRAGLAGTEGALHGFIQTVELPQLGPEYVYELEDDISLEETGQSNSLLDLGWAPQKSGFTTLRRDLEDRGLAISAIKLYYYAAHLSTPQGV
ncbi:hypothetical protein NDU88_007852 [Pleurodeles waltl]|uniref:Uncharacterized protein n=1 Tax=Pleurodeles waltl TaxID=8319 RepID=A0AAV7VUU4_PLEWA|nr:hypothetical protein NDU88_007852 [Pleurodeles waltl]